MTLVSTVEEMENEFYIYGLNMNYKMCRYYYERNEPGKTLAVNIDTICKFSAIKSVSPLRQLSLLDAMC